MSQKFSIKRSLALMLLSAGITSSAMAGTHDLSVVIPAINSMLPAPAPELFLADIEAYADMRQKVLKLHGTKTADSLAASYSACLATDLGCESVARTEYILQLANRKDAEIPSRFRNEVQAFRAVVMVLAAHNTPGYGVGGSADALGGQLIPALTGSEMEKFFALTQVLDRGIMFTDWSPK